MAVKAKRGWWLAVESTETIWRNDGPNETRTRVDLLEVTSCTRDGFVKDCRDAQGYASGSRWATGRVLTIPPESVPSGDVRRVAMAHHYNGHPNQMRPFESVGELREALRPFVVNDSPRRVERAS